MINRTGLQDRAAIVSVRAPTAESRCRTRYRGGGA